MKITPEKIVERQVLQWCLSKNWSVDVYDSKATYSQIAKSYRKSRSLKDGTPDLIGNDDNGLAVYLELKSPKINYCSREQWLFLKQKIDRNAFGLVVNSVEILQESYSHWKQMILFSEYLEARNYLTSLLPKKIKINGHIVNVS